METLENGPYKVNLSIDGVEVTARADLETAEVSVSDGKIEGSRAVFLKGLEVTDSVTGKEIAVTPKVRSLVLEALRAEQDPDEIPIAATEEEARASGAGPITVFRENDDL